MDRIDALLSEMTLEEKVAMVSGSGMWHSNAIDRLNIPAFKMTDGPNGARGDAVSGETAACFPVGVALASTWNAALIEEVGRALGQEAKSKGAQVLLGPTINLHRTPLGGRNFECYSEDPYLTGRLAVSFTLGVQSEKVSACLKHFVCNDSEYQRHSMSSQVDERSLREIYLLPFEMGVKEAGAKSVMSSYNRVNGTYAASHRALLTDTLKSEWGFDGFVVSDWGGSLETEGNANGGLDLEMPGPARTFGKKLLEAIGNGDVDEATIDDKVKRLLGLLDWTGKLDASNEIEEASRDLPEHRELARRTASESMVLLKNNGILPLDRSKLRKIAVIGPNAARGQIQGGGSSGVAPHYQVHPLGAIEAAFKDTGSVNYEPGCFTHKYAPPIDLNLLAPYPESNENGLAFEVFDNDSFEGTPVKSGLLRQHKVSFFGAFANVLQGGEFSVRYSGFLKPEETGVHEFGLMSAGLSRLLIDGKQVVDNWASQSPGDSFYSFGSTERRGNVELEEGRSYAIQIDFLRQKKQLVPGVQFGLVPPHPDNMMERAINAASEADAAILIVGTNSDWETEGNDRLDIRLPGDQENLIREALKVNPNTVIVMNAGSAVDMPWLEDAAALLYAWFPGQEFGNALSDVLFGHTSPSGRLPCTFPKRLEDTPAFTCYPGENDEVLYGEGLFVGYRWYDKRKIAPLFPFGYGLSYTRFAYENLVAPTKSDLQGPVVVTVDVKNTGDVASQEVVQLYVSDSECRLVRPIKELKRFEKVELTPGQQKTVTFSLEERDFSFWDPRAQTWVVEPGKFTVLVGSSSQDIHLAANIAIGS